MCCSDQSMIPRGVAKDSAMGKVRDGWRAFPYTIANQAWSNMFKTSA